eukprot:7377_1
MSIKQWSAFTLLKVFIFIALVIILTQIADISFVFNTNVYEHQSNNVNESYIFNKWYSINSNDISNHFVDYELLSMNITNPQCITKGDTPFFCCIGSFSTGGQAKWHSDSLCVKNNNTQNNYRKHLKYPNNRKAFNMNNIFWKLRNNSKIMILGDSVQHQMFNGMICDIKRHNQTINLHMSTANLSLLFSNWSSLLPIMKTLQYSNYKYTLNDKKAFNATFIAYDTYNNPSHIVHVIFLRIFRPWIPMYSPSDFCNWADVYLFSWDLHYDAGTKLWNREIGNGVFKLIQSCFNQYKHLSNMPIFIWRETTTQHFPSIGGYWFDIYKYPNSYLKPRDEKFRDFVRNLTLLERQKANRCYPLMFYNNDNFERYLWRERLLNFFADQLNDTLNVEIVYPNQKINKLSIDDIVYYIPFKDITDAMWDMHNGGECTHYCSGPYLWEFIWDEMYRIILANKFRN